MLQAPFPWFGGKSRAASLVWGALGACVNYVEPFFGSGAVLLGRPHTPGIETVNDKDAFLCNVFRALRDDPDGVLEWADFPVNEAQQHAVHSWLVANKATFTARLMGDPDYYDARVAGYWLYGICTWIGGEWCSGKGPWATVDGRLVHLGDAGVGIHRRRVHLGNAGQGIHRKLVHLGDAGRGIHRKLVHLGDAGRGEHGLSAWFYALQERLRRVRVCCGDWQRVLGPSVTYMHGLTGIFFDPPYAAEEGRDPAIYTEEDVQVAHAVREWCLQNGSNPLLRIILCGYDTTHDALLAQGWRKIGWHAGSGYATRNSGNLNRLREQLWCSPHCEAPERQLSLFAG